MFGTIYPQGNGAVRQQQPFMIAPGGRLRSRCRVGWR